MHFFGLLGVINFFIGFVMAMWIIGEKMMHVYYWHDRAPLVTSSPLFYVGMLAMIIGTQLFLAGFIGELVSRSNPERNQYDVKQTIN